jgi:hypothetical protein
VVLNASPARSPRYAPFSSSRTAFKLSISRRSSNCIAVMPDSARGPSLSCRTPPAMRFARQLCGERDGRRSPPGDRGEERSAPLVFSAYISSSIRALVSSSRCSVWCSRDCLLNKATYL